MQFIVVGLIATLLFVGLIFTVVKIIVAHAAARVFTPLCGICGDPRTTIAFAKTLSNH